jgi:hypothetical protein
MLLVVVLVSPLLLLYLPLGLGDLSLLSGSPFPHLPGNKYRYKLIFIINGTVTDIFLMLSVLRIRIRHEPQNLAFTY